MPTAAEYAILLQFITTFFGRSRRQTFLTSLVDALTAYEAIKATREAIGRAAADGHALSLPHDDVLALNSALMPLDRLARRIKNGDF